MRFENVKGLHTDTYAYKQRPHSLENIIWKIYVFQKKLQRKIILIKL